MSKLYFAKSKPDAKIPTKRLEDAGYDLYACSDVDEIEILPNKIKMIDTGIHSAFDSDYAMVIKERGSTGTKGMSVRCGVVDSGYRNEIKVIINNTSHRTIILSKDTEKTKSELLKGMSDTTYVDTNYTIYPMSKAIAQAVMLKVPNLETEEISLEDLRLIESERGDGLLDSTNK